MLPIPSRFSLGAGQGEAATLLNAFDAALLDAGFGNLNLLKVSSILPPEAAYAEELDVAPGSLLPTAYATISSNRPGDLIAAAVAVGIPDVSSFGVIMECSGHCSQQELEERIRRMVVDAFAMRHLPLRQIKVASVEHRVEICGSVLAGVGLWG
jgi:arginine decarboxylase